MKKFIFLLLTLSLALFAGDVARKGTTGADQLLIPVGARGIATGGAMLSVLNGIESIYYNPAGLSVNPSTEAMFSYMNYLADINVSYFAAATSLGDFGSIGLSFKTFDFGDIPVTTSEFPDGTGSTYSPSFLTAALTYSKIITDRISVGANFKLISETIMNTSASGFAIDAGVQYRLNENVSLGAALMNIGTNMTYDGEDLVTTTEIPGSFIGTRGGTYQVLTESFQLPSYFQMSVAYQHSFNEQNNFVVATTYTANNAYEDVMNFGLEYGFMGTFFVRGGYNLAMQESENSIFGFTAGAGVDYRVSQDIGLVFDYAFRDVKEFPEPNHIMTVKLRFNN